MRTWPHARGGHRGDRCSPGRGAARGVVRWRWRADDGAALGMPLVDDGRIAIVAGTTLHVLDGGAHVHARIPLEENASLGLLAATGPVVVAGARVVALDWRGAELWQLALEQPVRAMQRSPADDLAVCSHERDFPPRGALVVVDREGTPRWRTDDHSVYGAACGAPELAFDDDGNLYSLMTARLGDGVSGDDVLVVSCRGFDPRGAPLWEGSIGPRHPSAIQARSSGVVVIGSGRAHGYDPSGAEQWDFELDAGATIRLDTPAMELVRSCAQVRLSRILHRRAPNVGTVLTGIHDADDTLYLTSLQWSPPRLDALLAIGTDDRLRWQLPLPATPYTLPCPVIGPDATVLLAYGDELIAVE